MEIKEILEKLQNNQISLEEAEKYIKHNQYDDLEFAKIDHNRKERSGASEVVFCQGKPDEFLAKIFMNIYQENGEVLGTRATKAQYELLKESIPNIQYNEMSKILKIEKKKDKLGNVAICTGGTADIPVAEEAKETLEFFGNHVEKFYDVGVAGIHRVLSHREEIEKATCVIAIAGMEGALASVVAGLVSVPVIAVPTSIGYGANFGGLTPLLSMINSCSNGVSVVNIDNGYGAGYIASRINLAISKKF